MNTITVSEFDENGRALDSYGQLIVIDNNGTTMVLKPVNNEIPGEEDKLKVVIESINV